MARIAHFIDTTVMGGAEVLIIKLMSSLKEHGHEGVLLHVGHEDLEQAVSELDLSTKRIPSYEHYRSVRTLPLFAYSFSKFLKQEKIDIVHSHLYGPVTASSLGVLGSNAKHVGTLHDTYIIDERPRRIHFLELAALLGTRLVTVSKKMEEHFRNLGRFRSSAIETVYNGVTIPSIDESVRAKKRAELGVKAEETLFVCVGRLVEVKNHRLLIESVSKLSSEIPFKVLLVGEGPLRASLEEEVKSCGLDDKVCFLGHRGDVLELLTAADCFLLASHSEGLSYSILEAMSVGLPVVATSVGGNVELILENETGHLVPPGNAEVFASRLNDILRDCNKRNRFSENARARALEHFSFSGMLDRYHALYDELLTCPA